MRTGSLCGTPGAISASPAVKNIPISFGDYYKN